MVPGLALPARRRVLQRARLPAGALPRLNADSGREEIKAEGRWWPIYRDNVLTLPTPDGNARACWSGPGSRPRFRCIILPGMARLDGPGATLAAVPAPGPSALEVLAAGR
jgi:hypothetical protein